MTTLTLIRKLLIRISRNISRSRLVCKGKVVVLHGQDILHTYGDVADITNMIIRRRCVC